MRNCDAEAKRSSLKVWWPLFFLPFLSSACVNDVNEVEAFLSKFQTDVEVAKDVVILYSDSAVVRVRISGPTMLQYLDKEDPRQEFPDDVLVEFFGSDKSINSTLSAKYGVRHERQERVVVRDSVVWKNVEGDKLETMELIWSEAEGKIYTDHFVVITRPDKIIYGRGFEADSDFTKWRILAPEGTIFLNDEDKKPAEKPFAD